LAFAILHLLEQKPGRFFHLDVLGYVMLNLSTVFMAAALVPGTEKQLVGDLAGTRATLHHGWLGPGHLLMEI